jgi:hypothetical protein
MRRYWLIVGYFMVAMTIYLSLFTLALPKTEINHADKFSHFIAYSMMMLWLGQAFIQAQRMGLMFALITLGIVIEIIQPSFGRQFDWLDILANSSGVLIAWIALLFGADVMTKKLAQ